MQLTGKNVIVLGFLLSTASAAQAQLEWNSLVGGQWSTPGNWNPVGIPTISDPVTVSLPGTYAIQVQGSVASSGNLTITNPDASVAIHPGLDLRIDGDFINDANVVVNIDSQPSASSIVFESPASSLTGGGTIVLNAAATTSGALLLPSVQTNILNHGPGHTIAGTGQIRIFVINNGLIDAAGGRIALSFNDKTNNNVMSATSGGVLEINNITIAQSPSGVLRGNAGNIESNGGTIVGGTIEGFGGGVFTGSATIDGVTLLGDAHVLATQTLNVENTFINNGTVSINPNGDSFAASMNMASTSNTIDGNGEIVLNAVGLSFRAQMIVSGASTNRTNGTNHTISGNGLLNIDLTNQGIISPGHPDVTGDETQTIFVSSNRTLANAASGSVHIQIAGTAPGEYDLIDGGAFNAGGTLRIENIDGFGGLADGQFIDIITTDTGVTGTFANVQLIGGAAYNVLYLPDRVRLEMGTVCVADVNNDGMLTPADFTAWINAFNNNLPECDQNGDNACTPADFTAWIANYNAGCP